MSDPSQILQTGFGFFGSKVVLTAVELEVFTALGDESMTGPELGERLGFHPRGTRDFFDALLALGFLERTDWRYSNTPETRQFLCKDSETYVGGMLEMCSTRLYKYWDDLPAALRTGQPQNEVKHSKKPIFEELYADAPKLEGFLNAMAGISMANFQAFAEKFDFSNYKTMCDVGGATGQLSMFVARAHEHMTCTSFDLPVVEPIAQKRIAASGMQDRVSTASGDFFEDDLPKADVITMGMILHDWNLDRKKHLVRLAYDALPDGGAFAIIENLIDDDRRENAFGLLMSLNMLIEFGDAYDFTGAEFNEWCIEAGFKRTEVVHLAGPCSAGIAYK